MKPPQLDDQNMCRYFPGLKTLAIEKHLCIQPRPVPQMAAHLALHQLLLPVSEGPWGKDGARLLLEPLGRVPGVDEERDGHKESSQQGTNGHLGWMWRVETRRNNKIRDTSRFKIQHCFYMFI